MTLSKFKQFFTPPVFENDEDKTRITRHLYFLQAVVLIAAPLSIGLFYFISPTSLPRVFTVVIPIPLIFLIATWMARRGWVYPGAFFIVLIAWVASTANNFMSGGLKTPGFGVGSLLIIILAGLLLGQRGAFLTILLNVIMAVLFSWADTQPWMPPVPSTVSSLSILTSYLLNMIVAGALMYATIASIRNSLDRARIELAERREVESELLQREHSYRTLYETAQKQARELALEGNIRTAMMQKLDLPVLLQSVVESIANSYGYALVSLYLIEGDALILQHQVGYEHVIQKIPLTKGVSGRVVRSGKSVLLENVHSDPEFLGAIEGLVSEICVPLFDEGRVVGTLNVESTNDIKLSGADLELLTGLSEHIGLAIGQARLYGNVTQRNRVLSALEESTLVIMQHLDQDTVLKTIVSQAAQILGTTHGYIYLVQADEKTMRVSTGIGVFSKSIGMKLEPNEGLAGKVWRSGTPLNVPDYHAWLGRSPQFNDVEFQAVVGVPLMSRVKVVGVLGLASLEPAREFSEKDVELLNQFAKLASLALENARLYTDLHSELNKQIALRNAGAAISSSLNLREVLSEICKQMATTIDATSAYIVQYKPDQSAYTVVADYVGPNADDLERVSDLNVTYYRKDGVRFFDKTSQESFFILQTDSDDLVPSFRNNLISFGGKSVLEIPLYVQGNLLGHAELWESRRRREFTPDEISFCQAVSQQAAIAIANASLFEQLQSELVERKRVEATLRESEALYRQAIIAAGAVPYRQSYEKLNDFQARVLFDFIGDGIKELTGYSPEEFDDTIWDAIVQESDLIEELAAYDWLDAIHQVRSGKLPVWKCEHRIRTRDGNTRWVLEAAVELPDQNGISYGSIGILQDITERKRAEEERENLIAELERRNAELERFTYTVSHDLKSPLVTINGFLGFLEKDVASGDMDRYRVDSQRIQDAVKKMQLLLSDLLELSRIGRMMNAPETIDFSDLVRDALENVYGQLETRGIKITLQPDLPSVYGDRQRLVEVLQNLVDNATKYIGDRPDPYIEIGVRGKEDGKPIFFVEDNGIGIAPEYHDRIFGLFNKLDPKAEGTGIGLALVKRIIELHGGRIWVESEEGKGSTFYFTLSSQQHPT